MTTEITRQPGLPASEYSAHVERTLNKPTRPSTFANVAYLLGQVFYWGFVALLAAQIGFALYMAWTQPGQYQARR